MTKFLREQGLQQQYQGKIGGKSFEEMRREASEAVQNVAGLLVGEYYPNKEKFSSEHPLVKELQKDLIKLGYDLGNTEADGKLGAKTKTAMHNFEQDHAKEVREAARTQAEIQNSLTHKKGTPHR